MSDEGGGGFADVCCSLFQLADPSQIALHASEGSRTAQAMKMSSVLHEPHGLDLGWDRLPAELGVSDLHVQNLRRERLTARARRSAF